MISYHVGLLKPSLVKVNRTNAIIRSSNAFRCHGNPIRCSLNIAIKQRSRVSSYRHRTTTPANQQPRFVTKAGSSDIDISSLLDDLDLPEIDADLGSVQAEAGAVFDVSFL
jgi:hypothetical protein